MWKLTSGCIDKIYVCNVLVGWLNFFFFLLGIMDFVTLKVSFKEALYIKDIQRLYPNEQLSSFLNIIKMFSSVFTSVQLYKCTII